MQSKAAVPNIENLVKGLGSLSSLPPLALAAEKQLVQNPVSETMDDIGESGLERDGLEQAPDYTDEDSAFPEHTDIPIRMIGKLPCHDLTDALPSVPPRGTFDLRRVMDSPYFFS